MLATIVFWFMFGLIFWLVVHVMFWIVRAVLSIFGGLLEWLEDWLIEKFVE